jgi:DNA-binding PadR family transcriptional regulator
MILRTLKRQPLHGYALVQQIKRTSNDLLQIEGRWLEKANQRRRRYYRLTAQGERILADRRRQWLEFAGAVARITGVQYA